MSCGHPFFIESRRVVLSAMLVLSFLASNGSRVGALELVPQPFEEDAGDGHDIVYKLWAFPDGDEEVVYQPPDGWDYRISPNGLFLTPGPPQASISIDSTILDNPLVFDLEGIEYLKEQTLKAVPVDAADAEVISDSKNFGPPAPQDYDDHEVVIGYKLAGVEFRTSVLYLMLKRKPQLVRFVTTARAQEFEGVREELRGSLYSWRWRPRQVAKDSSAPR